MQITFWGIRGSIPAPGSDTIRYGGNTSCVEVRLDNGTLIVFDAGTGLRPLGHRLMAQAQPVKIYLFLSHMHWDHIQGLPFFVPGYNRETEICILGPHGGLASLEQRICDQMRAPYYPIPMHAMAANFRFTELTEGSVVELPGAKIEVGILNHPGKTLGYRLLADDKVLVYATDNEPFGKLPGSQHLTCPSRILALAQGANLLIQDAQYTPDEYPQRIGWGHSTYLDALHIAHDAEVERLVLFHHDPTHSDAQVDRIVTRCRAWIKRRGLALDCLSAAEGLQLTP
ncbi:MAG: MBL fold metallo-hydrolase [bacterium]|nr:MBL fold metallo-hydrolase [bacterium]